MKRSLPKQLGSRRKINPKAMTTYERDFSIKSLVDDDGQSEEEQIDQNY